MNPEQIATCTKLHIEGKSIRDIAPVVDRSPSAVAQTLRKPEIRALIEREAQEIINRGLRPARRTLTRLAAIGNKGTDKDMLKLSLDASKHITSMAGLSGTTPSTVINALIQVNEAPQVSREIEGLAQYLQSKWVTGIEAPHTPVPDSVIDLPVSPRSDRDGSDRGA